MVGNTITASATVRHEACAHEQRLNMSAHHWRKVRAMRVGAGDGRGPKRTKPKTDVRGEIIYSKEKGGGIPRGSELLTMGWCERWLSMPTDRKMLSSDLEELE